MRAMWANRLGVYHIDIFRQWINGRDQIDCKLKIAGIKLTAIKIYRLNWL